MRYRALIAPSREESGQARERALERTLNNLRSEPRVEAADYNYIRTASWVPNDPKFGDLAVDPRKDPASGDSKRPTFLAHGTMSRIGKRTSPSSTPASTQVIPTW